MSKNGFVLTETVIVCAVISALLIASYYPFSTAINSYEVQKKYNTEENIYKLNNVRNYIYKYGNVNVLIDKLSSDKTIISINKLNFEEDVELTYTNLINQLGVERIYISNYNKINFSGNLGVKEYIDSINNSSGKNDYNNLYRLIAKFNDGTYGSIKIWKQS